VVLSAFMAAMLLRLLLRRWMLLGLLRGMLLRRRVLLLLRLLLRRALLRLSMRFRRIMRCVVGRGTAHRRISTVALIHTHLGLLALVAHRLLALVHHLLLTLMLHGLLALVVHRLLALVHHLLLALMLHGLLALMHHRLLALMLHGRGMPTVKAHGPADSHIRRPSTIIARKGVAIRMGRKLVLLLERGVLDVMIALSHALLPTGFMMNAARTAAEGHVAIPSDEASLHRAAILVDVTAAEAYVHDRSVIGKESTAPHATGKANAAVTKAVIHAAVKAHVRTPVTMMKDIRAVLPSPVLRRPQQARSGCGNPGTGNPVIAFIAISPIAGSPHIAGFGAGRLHINRQWRRSNVDTDEDASKRRCGDECKKQCQHKPAGGTEQSHEKILRMVLSQRA